MNHNAKIVQVTYIIHHKYKPDRTVTVRPPMDAYHVVCELIEGKQLPIDLPGYGITVQEQVLAPAP